MRADRDDKPQYVIKNNSAEETFYVEEVHGAFLEHLRNFTNEFLKKDITRAVITVPANFKDTQKAATKSAAEIAGWNVLRILTEPVAAALAYMQDPNTEIAGSDMQCVIVFDFGGGTLDVTACNLSDGNMEVITTDGNQTLGGQDIEMRIINWIASKIFEDT